LRVIRGKIVPERGRAAQSAKIHPTLLREDNGLSYGGFATSPFRYSLRGMRPNPSTADARFGGSSDGLPPHSYGDGPGGPGGSGPDYGERLRRARLGLAVGLMPVLTLFLSFTVVYALRQGWILTDSTIVPPHTRFPQYLPWTLFAINTTILVLSSLTVERARRDATRAAALAPVKSIPGISLGDERMLPWMEITGMLGLIFLIGQYWAWRQLEARGVFLSTTSGSSFVYLVTGMHAVHLAAGLAAIGYAIVGAMRQQPVEMQRIVVDVTAWFWHFLTALWVYVLALLALAR
jgi:cytochrome c oxidase subunit III